MASESVVALQPRVDTVDQLIQERARAFCLARKIEGGEWEDGALERVIDAGRRLWGCYSRADVRHNNGGKNCDAYLAKLRRELDEYRAIIAEHAPACTVLPFRRREG